MSAKLLVLCRHHWRFGTTLNRQRAKVVVQCAWRVKLSSAVPSASAATRLTLVAGGLPADRAQTSRGATRLTHRYGSGCSPTGTSARLVSATWAAVSAFLYARLSLSLSLSLSRSVLAYRWLTRPWDVLRRRRRTKTILPVRGAWVLLSEARPDRDLARQDACALGRGI